MSEDFKVEIEWNDLPQGEATSREDTDAAIRALAQHGRNLAVQKVQTPSPGTPQVRYNPKRTVTAAAPGQPPNTDTGNLAGSIQVEDGGELEQIIAVGAEYGEYLELGTEKMPARPFMTPTIDELQKEVTQFFQNFLAGLGR